MSAIERRQWPASGLKTLVGLAALAGCAPGVAGGGAPGEATAPAGALVPAGRGTLRQDDFTVRLRSGALLVKVTPLAEPVIRLAAPDTYDRLHALAASRGKEATRESGVTEPALFLVSFFSYEPDTGFQPEDLQLLYQGRLHRAHAILPITTGWGAQRLAQQETQSAIFAFTPALDPDLPFSIRYGSLESGEWSRIIPRLQAERAKIRGRTS